MRKMKAPGKSDISSLAMKVGLLSGFCSAKDSVWLNEVVWVTLGKVRKLCMECIHPEIATAKLNSIFDCWTFWRHLITLGNLVHKSFLSIGYLSH